MAKNGTLKEVIRSWYRGWTDEHITTQTGSLYHSNGVLYSYGDHFPLALHLEDKVLINGDRYSNTTSKHQAYTFHAVSEWERVEIPFSALANALGKFEFGDYGLDMQDLKSNLRVIDQEGDTWIDTGKVSDKTGEPIMQHVLGACIFRYGYDQDARYFFSGIDETGIGTHRYFLTELVAPVETVAEGLESMKPQVVKDAEKAGKNVLRQGEWFFIECEEQDQLNKDLKGLIEKDYTLVRREGDTGHHFAKEGVNIGVKAGNTEITQYVRGMVKHSGKEHKVCKLYEDVKDKKWFTAHHNIQVKSFTAVGNVD